jgi:hypothetical protein
VELVQELLKNLSLPGIVISIILIVIKINPITLISSSFIEIKLKTKEERFYIKAVRSFFEIIVYLMFIMLITVQLFSDKSIYSPLLTIIATVINIGVFFGIMVLDLQGKTFINLVKDTSKVRKVMYSILLLIHFLSFFIIPAYYIGTQLYSEFYNNSLTDNQKYGALLAVIISYLILITTIYFTVIHTLYKFIGFSNNTNKHLSIIKEDITWYIFHPIENDLFLLGNEPVLNKCTRITFLEKNDLLKEKIEIVEIN